MTGVAAAQLAAAGEHRERQRRAQVIKRVRQRQCAFLLLDPTFRRCAGYNSGYLPSGPFAPTCEARRHYLHAHPPDGSIKWWVDLAGSEMIENATPHIRNRVLNRVENIQDPTVYGGRKVPFNMKMNIKSWRHLTPEDKRAFDIKAI